MTAVIDEQKMSPLVKRLHRQIVKEGGYSCFAEQVSTEQVLFAYAHAIGVPVAELLRQWAGGSASPEVPQKPTPPPAVSEDGDDDTVCPDCGGSGEDSSGDPCETCSGSGRIAARDPEDDEGDGDGDAENDKKSYRYEFEEE